jgi:acetyl esterase
VLDQDIRDLLDRFEADGVRPYEQLGVLESRRMVEGAVRLQGEPAPVAEVRDLLVAGAQGMLPARLYRPAGDGADERPPAGAPGLVVYFHGGGWALGSVAVADRSCRALAAGSGCAVISVEYRRAPETRFPGALEDCFSAVAWLAAHAGELSCDAGRLAVMGDSAGGNLAAAVALMARDRQGSPALRAQVLVYPCLAARGHEFPSHTSNGQGYSLTRGSLEWFWDLYVGSGADGADPYAAPLAAADLSGLPPAVVMTAGYDPLRDEGRAYIERLRSAAVPVVHLDYPGAIHGVLWMDGVVAAGRRLLVDLASQLRHRLGSASLAPRALPGAPIPTSPQEGKL